MNKHSKLACSAFPEVLSFHWLRCTEDGHLLKDVLYDELASGSRPVGGPMLRYKDVCTKDMKSPKINPDLWEAVAADPSNWHCVVRTGVKRAEAKMEQLWHDRRDNKDQEQLLHPPYQQRTCAATVTETATQELDSTVTADAATIQ